MTTLKVLMTSSALVLLATLSAGAQQPARRTRYTCRTRCACGGAGRTAGLWGPDHP